MDEFCDLQTDPMEMRNLIADAGARTELAKLPKELQRYRKEVSA